jgi:hypothetical protein
LTMQEINPNGQEVKANNSALLAGLRAAFRRNDNDGWRWRCAFKQLVSRPSCCGPVLVNVRFRIPRERRADGCCEHRTCEHPQHDRFQWRRLPITQAIPVLALDEQQTWIEPHVNERNIVAEAASAIWFVGSLPRAIALNELPVETELKLLRHAIGVAVAELKAGQ